MSLEVRSLPYIDLYLSTDVDLKITKRLIINPSHPRYYQLSPELKKALLKQDKY